MTPTMPISTRLGKVDYRIWYFLFTVTVLIYQCSLMESVLRYGLDSSLLVDVAAAGVSCFTIYSAVHNGTRSLKIVKVYTILCFNICSLVSLIMPVILYKTFDKEVAREIRKKFDHHHDEKMGFWQSLGYCIYYELNLVLINIAVGLQWWLIRKVQKVIRDEKKKGAVEMGELI